MEPIVNRNYKLTESQFHFNRIFVLFNSPWKVYLLIMIGENTLRFSDIKKNFTSISRVTITKHLKQLEQEAFIIRVQAPTLPLRTEYSLTPMALEILPRLQELVSWGNIV